MGTSTNAILGYGITFEEGEEPWNLEDGSYENSPETWLEAKIANSILHMKECPLKIQHHCSGDCTMYAILIKESVTIARRGYPVEIGLPNDDVIADWEIELCKWLDALEIKAPHGHFWLMSYWG